MASLGAAGPPATSRSGPVSRQPTCSASGTSSAGFLQRSPTWCATRARPCGRVVGKGRTICCCCLALGGSHRLRSGCNQVQHLDAQHVQWLYLCTPRLETMRTAEGGATQKVVRSSCRRRSNVGAVATAWMGATCAPHSMHLSPRHRPCRNRFSAGLTGEVRPPQGVIVGLPRPSGTSCQQFCEVPLCLFWGRVGRGGTSWRWQDAGHLPRWRFGGVSPGGRLAQRHPLRRTGVCFFKSPHISCRGSWPRTVQQRHAPLRAGRQCLMLRLALG